MHLTDYINDITYLLTYLLTYMNGKAKAHVLMLHVTYKPAILIIRIFVHKICQFKNLDGSIIKKSRTKGSICPKAKDSGVKKSQYYAM